MNNKQNSSWPAKCKFAFDKWNQKQLSVREPHPYITDSEKAERLQYDASWQYGWTDGLFKCTDKAAEPQMTH